LEIVWAGLTRLVGSNPTLSAMTRRRPPGIGWESWIDRQVREAEKRGEFDDLPGAGKPLPDLGSPRDENWWIKNKLRDEGLSYAPPSLYLKKKIEDAVALAFEARSEGEARKIVEGINEEIRAANRKGLKGPPIVLRPYDVEGVLRDWRARHRR
jgi:Domain of unknown function (DUF1992)